MMFQRRLKWFSILLAGVALALIGRLVDLQVLRAEEYEELAARMLVRPERFLPAPRGGILDRRGRVLVRDTPAPNVSVHYLLLAGNADYLRAVARALRKRGELPTSQSLAESVAELRRQIDHMWQRLAELTGRPVADLLEQGQRIRRRVERIRADRARRLGFDQPVEEEKAFHPLLENASEETALAVRLELERYPWIRVVPDSRRMTQPDADGLDPLLGRVAAVSPERMEQDPLRDDDLRKLLPNDRCGVSGTELLADTLLRGTRGRVVDDWNRKELERTEPIPGQDAHLTIDAELQRRILLILKETVDGSVHPCGAAAVVIDAGTREVLALASYPYFSHEDYAERYDELRQDTRTLPLLFRAVAAQYPPGSTCKAITLIGALSDGKVNENTRIHCNGFFQRQMPDSFRCWIYNQYGKTHDEIEPEGQNAESAIRNSCNIYFYTIGDLLGPERLCEWFSKCGLGRLQGSGLIEEVPGIVPSAEWLFSRRGTGHQPSDAWNFAIGQGEVTITPLQAANVAATIASGRWEPVRLLREDEESRLVAHSGPAIRFDEQVLRVLRSGMWRVVNEHGGTADVAKLDRSDYQLCGKTGSAQAAPRVVRWRYTCEWPDGRREEIVATSRQDALDRFPAEKPRITRQEAAERYPELEPEEKLPSHAWFIGYTQPNGTRRGAAPRGKVYAISIIIEYGGSGGKVAGPAAKRIAEAVLDGD